MAGEALKLLTGIGQPLIGRALVYDALSGRTREISYQRAADATPAPSASRAAAGAPPRPTRAGTGAVAAAVATVEAPALADELASDAPPLLLDVRETWEAEIAALPGSVLIPLGELDDRAGELDPAASVVVYCHLGVRSQRAAEQLASNGFADVRNLAGGIDAWSRSVDSAVARY